MAENPAPRRLTAEEKATIVEMYSRGEKLIDITRATGATRSTIYWVLSKAGIEPERIAKPAMAEGMNSSDLLDALRAALVENGRLREALDRERALNEALLERLPQVSKAPARRRS